MNKRLEIIPAIDLLGGRAVRLLQGDYQQATAYHNDPIALARHWAMRKAPRLHLVDLDGAKAGEPMQFEIIRQICTAVALPIQVGGGVRSRAHVDALLDVGVERVILGTAALTDPDLARKIFQHYGERVALALDVRAERVAISGWQTVSNTHYLAFAQQMVEEGVRRIVFTNIALDGTLSGVELSPLQALLEAVFVPVIVSGGVRDEEDIQRLNALAQTTSLEGVVVGKALYEGTLPDTIWEAL